MSEGRGVEAPLERLDLETGGLDRGLGVARRLAAAEGTRPEEPVGRTLEAAEENVAGADVLPESELSARREDPP